MSALEFLNNRNIESIFIDDISAAMEVLESPMVFDNGDGTSSVEDADGSAVQDLDSESLEEFLDLARYGEEIQHGSYRNNRDFSVEDNKLYVRDKRRS